MANGFGLPVLQPQPASIGDFKDKNDARMALFNDLVSDTIALLEITDNRITANNTGQLSWSNLVSAIERIYKNVEA